MTERPPPGDRRRAPYAAIDVHYPFSDTSHALTDRFGTAGPYAFLLLILAAKRAPIQGQITYYGPTDFWQQIGWPDDEEPPDLALFLDVLARQKQASRRGSGRRSDVARTSSRPRVEHLQLTNFDRWQTLPRSFAEARRKSRSRAGITADTTADDRADDTADDTADDRAPERRERGVPTPPPELEPGEATHDDAASTRGSGVVSPALGDRNGQWITPADVLERAATYVRDVGWQDPHLDDDLHERYPSLSPADRTTLANLGREIHEEHEHAASTAPQGVSPHHDQTREAGDEPAEEEEP